VISIVKSDFYFELPKELIAQEPLQKRDTSRLLALNRITGEVNHLKFTDLENLLNAGDCLVLNDSKVLPARLYGKKQGTGGQIEFVLLNQKQVDVWEVILKPGKMAKIGAKFIFGDGLLKAEVVEIIEDGNRIVKFEYSGNFFDIIEKIGEMPLPHYITKKLEDKNRYQTVYAKELGSAAAPTAGLHFTPELLERLRVKGVITAFVTLHVGLGTFRPVKEDDISEHIMHSEHYELSQETADAINSAKANGKRIVAVGTTSCRTLETVIKKEGCIRQSDGWTSIFIYPGYEFGAVDAVITNFHLPESTLIMLVSAFAGRENILNAYKQAIEQKYRFYSFGDAMFIF
jgi:S-adenosylmethionine:tRNA ribosyltransferase-isomerase